MARNTQRDKEPTPPTDETVPEAAGEAWLDGGRTREVARLRTFSDTDLGAIDSWDAAMAMAKAAYGDVVNGADALGNGFKLASDDDMERLCGVPLLLLEWDFYPGDFGKDFVSIRAVQKLDDGGVAKWIINDGGTGICDQLQAHQTETGATGGLGLPKGLRVSKFYFDTETQAALTRQEVRQRLATGGRNMAPARTFYLDTSA